MNPAELVISDDLIAMFAQTIAQSKKIKAEIDKEIEAIRKFGERK